MIIKFNKVYIIESLQDGELKTGKKLWEDLRHFNGEDENYGFEHQIISTKKGLQIFFDSIKHNILKKELVPIIHLEMHGDLHGIQMSSGEKVTWCELSKYLQEINILLKNKLIVILALCYGIHFISCYYKSMDQRTPFALLISSPEELFPQEILKGFSDFYKVLAHDLDGAKAFKRLNEQIIDEKRHFELLSCKELFANAYIEYLKLCSQNNVKIRTEDLISKIRKINPFINITDTRKQIKNFLKKENQEDEFKLRRRKFLMYDLDKNNVSNFNIEFEEILKKI